MRRDNAVEWLRVASALGIVWFHSRVTGWYWGYAGLIVFLIMSIMFEAGPNAGRALSVIQLMKRLILPWALWWLIYAVLNAVRGQPLVDGTYGVLLGALAGPSIHLWYLPFMFGVLATFGMVKVRLPVPIMAVGAAVVAIALIVTIPIWKPASILAGPPLAQWMHACVPIFIGILTGCAMRARWPWLLAAAVAAALVWGSFRAFPDVAIIYLFGFALVAGVLALPRNVRERAPDAGVLFSSMLGVYLVHPLALALLRPLTLRFELGLPLLVFILSTIGVLVAQWIAPYPSSLLLGTRMPTDQPKALFRSNR